MLVSSSKVFPQICSMSSSSEAGSKIKYLNFTKTRSVFNFLTKILHGNRGIIDMEHIKCFFSLTASVRSRGRPLGVGQMPNILFSPEYGHVAYQIKENDTYNNMQANCLHTASTLGWWG